MSDTKPSRNPWPIAIIAFFAVFITYLVTFGVWASRQHQDLVAPNYYDTEIRYQHELEKLNRTQALGDAVSVIFDAAQNAVVIKLPPGQAAAAQGRIFLYRPDDARLDRVTPLAVNPDGVQRLDAKSLRAGQWKIRVAWSAGGQEYFLDRAVIVAGKPEGRVTRVPGFRNVAS